MNPAVCLHYYFGSLFFRLKINSVGLILKCLLKKLDRRIYFKMDFFMNETLTIWWLLFFCMQNKRPAFQIRNQTLASVTIHCLHKAVRLNSMCIYFLISKNQNFKAFFTDFSIKNTMWIHWRIRLRKTQCYNSFQIYARQRYQVCGRRNIFHQSYSN